MLYWTGMGHNVESPRKRGRRLFNPEQVEKLVEMVRQGYSVEMIAVTMDCSVSTVYNYKRRVQKAGGRNI